MIKKSVLMLISMVVDILRLMMTQYSNMIMLLQFHCLWIQRGNTAIIGVIMQ